MGLVNTKDILKDCLKLNYGVGSFSLADYNFVIPLIEAAYEERSPIIIQCVERHFEYYDIESISIMIRLVANRYDIPIALHLDHAKKIESIEKAIKLSFSSVMIDGSSLEYEENINLTKIVVELAHKSGVSVEAELGGMPGSEGAIDYQKIEPCLFTDPLQVKDFVSKTGVDFLAIAIGTVHGKFKDKPRLDYPRLERIKENIDIPLVLHGSSGLSNDDYNKLIDRGVVKLNIFTNNCVAALDAVKKFIKENPETYHIPDMFRDMNKAVKDETKKLLRLFRSTGKV